MDIVRFEEVGSTNDECARLGMEGAASGTAVVARRQNAGRGRLARRWIELDGDNLFLSVLGRTRLAPERISGLTLAVGLAVAEALDGVGPRVGLKWPNDLVVDGKKLGGILCELHHAGHEQHVHSLGRLRLPGEFVVVGVGLNVGARHLPEPIAATATSLALLGEAPPIAEVEARVIAAVRDALARYEVEGRPDVARWQARAAGVGQVGVRVLSVPDGRRATVTGIASDGALLLLWDGAERPEPLIAGELVVEP